MLLRRRKCTPKNWDTIPKDLPIKNSDDDAVLDEVILGCEIPMRQDYLPLKTVNSGLPNAVISEIVKSVLRGRCC